MARRPSTTAKSTPLRDWRARNPEVSWEQLASETGLSTSTVKRAAEGKAVDEASSRALAARTGIDAAAFRGTSTATRTPKRTTPPGDRGVKPATATSRTKSTEGQGARRLKDARSRAAVLVFAELKGDERASVVFDVSERTIRRWRADLATDPELARAYAHRLEAGWSRKLMALVEEAADAGLRLLRDGRVEDLRDVAALLETAAGLLVQREALNRRPDDKDDDDGKGESQAHRDGAAPRADRAGAREVTTH